jgi:hypothetical protein
MSLDKRTLSLCKELSSEMQGKKKALCKDLSSKI